MAAALPRGIQRDPTDPTGKAKVAVFTVRGRRFRRRLGRVSVREAVRLRQQLIDSSGGVTVGEMVEQHLQLGASRWTKTYLRDARRFAVAIQRAFGSELAQRLRPAQIQAHLDDQARVVGPAQANHQVRFLRAAYNTWDRKFRGASDPPIANPVRRGSVGFLPVARRNRGFTVDQEVRLLENLPTHYPNPQLVRMAILTGLRRANLVGLEWAWVDLEAETVTIPMEAYKSRREHVVPLVAEAVDILLDLPTLKAGRRFVFEGHANSWWGRAAEVPTDEDPRSWNWTGRPINYGNWYRKRWLPAVAAAGVPGMRFHDLRHTTGHRLTEAGVPTRTVQQILGHASIQSTEIYTKADGTAMRRALSELTTRQPPSETAPKEPQYRLHEKIDTGEALSLARKLAELLGDFNEASGDRTRDPRLKRPSPSGRSSTKGS